MITWLSSYVHGWGASSCRGSFVENVDLLNKIVLTFKKIVDLLFEMGVLLHLLNRPELGAHAWLARSPALDQWPWSSIAIGISFGLIMDRPVSEFEPCDWTDVTVCRGLWPNHYTIQQNTIQYLRYWACLYPYAGLWSRVARPPSVPVVISARGLLRRYVTSGWQGPIYGLSRVATETAFFLFIFSPSKYKKEKAVCPRETMPAF